RSFISLIVIYMVTALRLLLFFLMSLFLLLRSSSLFPYTTLFRSFSVASKSKKRDKTLLIPATFLFKVSSVSRFLSSDFPEGSPRSEEHTSELQSREKIVCRVLLEKKIIQLDINNTIDHSPERDEK